MNQTFLRILSIVATIVLVAAILILYSRGDLFSLDPVAIAIQAASVLFMVWARVVFGFGSFYFSPHPVAPKLITHGPYRLVRHPIYMSVLFFSGAGIAVHFSWLTAGLAAVILLAILVRVFCEETFLSARFEDYSAYVKRTSCLIPFL